MRLAPSFNILYQQATDLQLLARYGLALQQHVFRVGSPVHMRRMHVSKLQVVE